MTGGPDAMANYIEIDGRRTTTANWIDTGLRHATIPVSPEEPDLAVALLAELFDQCQGRGLTHHGGGSSDTGKQTILLAGSLDLIALARSAIAAIHRRSDHVSHSPENAP
jgi:hypothetical protein